MSEEAYLELTDHRQYAEEWAKEAALLDESGIYSKLADQIPPGRILEIGCGTGQGAAHLIKLCSLLSLDNNPFLLEQAERYVGHQDRYSTYECDFFNLSDTDTQKIEAFQPDTIAAWFIGGSGSDVFRNTREQPEITRKGKLYREKVEDLMTSSSVLVSSVHTINLAHRSGRLIEFSDADVIEATTEDYDNHVFRRCGFKVTDVRILDWPRTGSSFRYGYAPNPNLAPGTPVPTIITVIATRSMD